jgi:hypothetical protein
MTRSTLRGGLRRLYVLLFLLLAFSLTAKLAEHMPLIPKGITSALKDVYDLLRDMSLLIATVGVAYITNMFQKRSAMIESLKAEWHDIIAAKSALLTFMHKESPSHEEYIATFTRLSETIDNMRVVYRNVGETDHEIGLYPYAPLHDMRRVLQTLDPRDPASAAVDRKLARDTMLRSFYALREHFLEELDIEEPDSPILLSGARRLKMTGATGAAKSAQSAQQRRQIKAAGADDASDHLLRHLYEREQSKLQTGNGRSETPIPSGN